MAFEEWGGGGGTSAAIADLQTMANTDLIRGKVAAQPIEALKTMAETRHIDAQTARVPSQIDMDKASARLHQAQAAAAENDLQVDQALARVMSNGQVDPNLPPSEQAMQLSKMAGGVGSVKKSLEYMKVAEQFSGHESTVAKTRIEAQRAEFNQRKDALAQLQKDVVWVDSPEKLAALNAKFVQQYKEPPPWGDQPYSPQLIQAIQQASMTYSQQLDKRLHEEQLAALERQRAAQNALAEEARRVQQERLQLERQREQRLAKAGGGKVIGNASKDDIDTAYTMAKKDFPDISIKDEAVHEFAKRVANDAKAMRASNPALTPEQATYKAYQAAKEDFSLTNSTILGIPIPGTSTPKYNSTNTPRAFTPELQSAYAQGDYKNLKEGAVYDMPSGAKARWMKKPDGSFGWKAVQ